MTTTNPQTAGGRSSPTTEEIQYGAAYYPEYVPSRNPDRDLDLMQAAGFSVIRLGESVWSTWEPRDGEFDTEWLRPILDAAVDRGIDVVLGTPTYAVPPWLHIKHPELVGDMSTGVRGDWGARQEVDYSSDVFRHYAERVVRRIADTYATHPSIVGFQVDNEPGVRLFYNDHVFVEFRRRLEEKYGTPDNLNNEWGLVYWSHKITDFSQLWRPDGNTFPQYDLAWRRFQADLTTEFVAWQSSIVREYAHPNQFVTTCMSFRRPGMHEAQMFRHLDVTAGNPYYEMQHGLDLARHDAPIGHTVGGVGPFFRQANQLWSVREERFLVTETNAQSIGGHSFNLPPHPGQLKQAAYGLISRGARMIEYWHWQTTRYGYETYWGGVLPHSGVPGRIYDEISEIGDSLKRVGPQLVGFRPDADVTMVYSTASKWAFEFMAPLASDRREGDSRSYERIFDAFHSGVVESNRQAVIVQDVRLVDRDPRLFATTNPVLIVPAFYITSDEQLVWMNAYAEHGGHLILGIRSGYADEEARARADIAPPGFAVNARVHYDEYSNLTKDIGVLGTGELEVSPDAAATGWIDGLITDGAEVLAAYDHPELGRFPAITTTPHGSGRITYVGTVPNTALAHDIARWAAAMPLSAGWVASPDGCVLVQSGTVPRGRVWFVSNWSGQDSSVTAPVACSDLESGEMLTAGSVLTVHARDVRIFAEW